MLTVKRLAMGSTRGGSQGMYIIFASAKQIRQIPLWIWNLKETSPEIQNRGSGPKIGLVNVSAHKTFFLIKVKKKWLSSENNEELSFKCFGLLQKLLQFWKCLGHWYYNLAFLVTSLGFKVRSPYLSPYLHYVDISLVLHLLIYLIINWLWA